MLRFLLILFFLSCKIFSQSNFPFFENFDSVAVPNLPFGWKSSTNKNLIGDFQTTQSVSKSLPNTLISTDSKISQTLTTPILNFSGKIAESIVFYDRRSSTHNSGIILEFSINNDSVFAMLGDTLTNPGNTNYTERYFNLPQIISNNSSVRFRIRILGNGNSSTATYRIDDFEIKTKKIIDLSISHFKTIPQSPRSSEDFNIQILFKNFGINTNFKCSLNVFLDNQQLRSFLFDLNLAKSDSTIKSFEIKKLSAGNKILKFILATAEDEDTLNNSFELPIQIAFAEQSIIINEFMYNPIGDEPEWIEILNISSDTIDLKNWSISDATKSFSIVAKSENLILPNEYAVISSDSNFTSFYNYPIKLFVSNFPSLNNSSPDGIVLKDFTGLKNDSVFYFQTWGGVNGKSLERIDYNFSSTDSSNWISSNPTPGKINFFARRNFDLSVLDFSYIKILGGFSLSAKIKNLGREVCNNFSVRFFSEDEVFSQAISKLNPLEEKIIEFQWMINFSGSKELMCEIVFSNDERLANNFSKIIVSDSYKISDVVINEILFEASDSHCEFIELYNSTVDTINFSGWTISDLPTTSGNKNIISLKSFLPPKKYFVVASDSSVLKNYLISDTSLILITNSDLSLNNSSDCLILVDLTGKIIDSVFYNASWHLKNFSTLNRSIEKISPQLNSNDSKSWSSSVNSFGATPQKQNSVLLESTFSNATVSLSPNPFSPDFDGVEDFLSINYKLPQNSSTIKITIFDVSGRIVKKLVENSLTQNTGMIIWNGLKDDGSVAKVGPHIILLEAMDNFGGTILKIKKVVIVAKKL